MPALIKKLHDNIECRLSCLFEITKKKNNDEMVC